MKLKDLLKDYPINIMYRTHYKEKDMLAGYCFWTGTELVSLDGDDYSVDDEISGYEWNGADDLTIWYESNWIEG